MLLFETVFVVVFFAILAIFVYIWILISDKKSSVKCDCCKSKMDYVCRTRVVSPIKEEPDMLQTTYKCPKCGVYKTITEDL